MFSSFQAWLNERFSPELLESKAELVECMIDQVTEMEENIKRAKKGDFKISIHRMEVYPFVSNKVILSSSGH